MREIGPTTEAEMVLEFLRAEIDSPRFGPHCDAVLRQTGMTRPQLLDTPDLGDKHGNRARAAILGTTRGYGQGRWLFAGMPADTTWRRVEASPAELGTFRFARHEVWLRLSRDTRLVADGAANVDVVETGEATRDNVRGIISRLQRGDSFPQLIAVTDGGVPVLVEGHTRATAYVRANTPAGIAVLIGYSPLMSQWAFY